MNVKTCLNATREDVESKKFNIFIGLSLQNKIFTQQAIKEYIEYALKYSKDKIVVLIADRIASVNYQIISNYSKEKAISVSLKKGMELEKSINNILDEFSKVDKNRINIIHWEDIINEEYKKRLNIIKKYFFNNKKFRERILEIVREFKSNFIKPLDDEDLVKLASYPLDELPILVYGFSYLDIAYNLILYPGIGKVDFLARDIQEGKLFPEITKDLQIKNKLVIIEAYPSNIK